MILIILMVVLNVTLYFGEVKGISNALNVSMFIMWFMAILNVMLAFASDSDLLKLTDKNIIYVYSLRILTIGTVMHSVYWGWFYAPTVWFVSVIVRWVRIHELHRRKRF